jgi:hypothetical protein
MSQKELEKALHGYLTPHDTNKLSLMKARIDVVADFEDLKKIAAALKDIVNAENRDGSRHPKLYRYRLLLRPFV